MGRTDNYFFFFFFFDDRVDIQPMVNEIKPNLNNELKEATSCATRLGVKSLCSSLQEIKESLGAMIR